MKEGIYYSERYNGIIEVSQSEDGDLGYVGVLFYDNLFHVVMRSDFQTQENINVFKSGYQLKFIGIL